jgi:hypothetical protein
MTFVAVAEVERKKEKKERSFFSTVAYMSNHRLLK